MKQALSMGWNSAPRKRQIWTTSNKGTPQRWVLNFVGVEAALAHWMIEKFTKALKPGDKGRGWAGGTLAGKHLRRCWGKSTTVSCQVLLAMGGTLRYKSHMHCWRQVLNRSCKLQEPGTKGAWDCRSHICWRRLPGRAPFNQEEKFLPSPVFFSNSSLGQLNILAKDKNSQTPVPQGKVTSEGWIWKVLTW